MKKLIGILLIVAGVLGGLYLGLWTMFIGGIINIAQMIDLNTVTTTGLAKEILKIFLATPVGSVIAYIGVASGMLVFLKD